jgi:hypothetical protein
MEALKAKQGPRFYMGIHVEPSTYGRLKRLSHVSIILLASIAIAMVPD